METGGGRETGNGVLGAWEPDLLEIRPVAEAVSQLPVPSWASGVPWAGRQGSITVRTGCSPGGRF